MKVLIYSVILSIFLLSTGLASANAKDASLEPETVCVTCHSSMDGDLAKPVELWKQSIHHEKGNGCEGCHGGDPKDEATAMSPEKGFRGSPSKAQTAEFCGLCHVGVKENFMKSPHYLAGLAGKDAPTCTSCHQSHDVKKASRDLINPEACGQCHTYEQAEAIKNSFSTADLALEETSEMVESLESRGMDVARDKEKLFALRNSLHQLTHTLDVPLVKSETGSVLKDLESIKAHAAELRKIVVRRWVTGGAVALFFLVVALVLSAFKKTFDE